MKNLSVLSALSAAPWSLSALLRLPLAQVTTADYQRAQSLRQQYESAAVFVPDAPTWINGTHRFYYRRTLANGFEFVMVDADTRQKSAGLRSHAAGRRAVARLRPRVSRHPASLPDLHLQRCAERDRNDHRRRALDLHARRLRVPHAGPAAARRDSPRHQRPGSRRHLRGAPRPRLSPDGKWMAFIDNYNVALRPFGGDKRTPLSTDGSEGNYYDGASIAWSPDSSKVVAYRVRPGYRRLVHYVSSSPEDQLQPEHWAMQYAKPGDLLDLEQPVLFDVRSQKQITIDTKLFPNPYDMSDLVWRKDSRAFSFEYNQRGHQVYRIVEVDAHTGAARAVVSEEPNTFFYYNRSAATLQAGKRYRFDLADGKEVVWMSERDGWNHLYLIDGATGAVKNQITKGAWPVRHVIKVDEEKRQLWFSAGGMHGRARIRTFSITTASTSMAPA